MAETTMTRKVPYFVQYVTAIKIQMYDVLKAELQRICMQPQHV